jgi:hypothetical protein
MLNDAILSSRQAAKTAKVNIFRYFRNLSDFASLCETSGFKVTRIECCPASAQAA